MKTFCFPLDDEFKVKSLEVNCDTLKREDLGKLISMLVRKGFEIKSIIPYKFIFALKAETKGNKKDTQAIREELEEEGFTKETFEEQ